MSCRVGGCEIPEGQILYIVSATLAGKFRVRRYSKYVKNNVPSCYTIETCDNEDTGGECQLWCHDDGTAIREPNDGRASLPTMSE